MTASTRFESVDQARLLAESIVAIPGVYGLSGGNFGTVATYFPGERITGVRIEDKDSVDTLSVHVVVAADYRGSLRDLAETIRKTASTMGLPVNVYFEDIADAPKEGKSEPNSQDDAAKADARTTAVADPKESAQPQAAKPELEPDLFQSTLLDNPEA